MADKRKEKVVNARYDYDVRNSGANGAFTKMRERNSKVTASKKRDKQRFVDGMRSNISLGGLRPLSNPENHEADSKLGDFKGFGEGTMKKEMREKGLVRAIQVWDPEIKKFVFQE